MHTFSALCSDAVLFQCLSSSVSTICYVKRMQTSKKKRNIAMCPVYFLGKFQTHFLFLQKNKLGFFSGFRWAILEFIIYRYHILSVRNVLSNSEWFSCREKAICPIRIIRDTKVEWIQVCHFFFSCWNPAFVILFWNMTMQWIKRDLLLKHFRFFYNFKWNEIWICWNYRKDTRCVLVHLWLSWNWKR